MVVSGKKDMTLGQVLALIKATQPTTQTQGAITVNVPPISVPQPIVNIENLKVPEQKAPVVHVAAPVVNNEVRMPDQKEPNVIVNVAPPDVRITNDIKIPTTKKVKVSRDGDGKLSGYEVEKEA
jgi:hypothetical protein